MSSLSVRTEIAGHFSLAFGVIMWELASRQRPFADIGQFEITIKVGMEGLRLPLAATTAVGLP